MLAATYASAPPTCYTTRVRFVAIEGMFTFMFAARFETRLDILWTEFMPWKRESLPWLPLCSHTPLIERPLGFHTIAHKMTDDEIRQYNAERAEQVRIQLKAADVRYRVRQQENNAEAYLARLRKNKAAQKVRNPDRILATEARTRNRAIAAKKHHCPVCDHLCNTIITTHYPHKTQLLPVNCRKYTKKRCTRSLRAVIRGTSR